MMCKIILWSIKSELNAKNIYNFAMDLILSGTKSEAIKVGMSIMGYLIPMIMNHLKR